MPPGNFIHELEVTVLNGTKGGNRGKGGGWQGVRRVLMTVFKFFYELACILEE